MSVGPTQSLLSEDIAVRDDNNNDQEEIYESTSGPGSSTCTITEDSTFSDNHTFIQSGFVKYNDSSTTQL